MTGNRKRARRRRSSNDRPSMAKLELERASDYCKRVAKPGIVGLALAKLGALALSCRAGRRPVQ
jgi:hypothetical protein